MNFAERNIAYEALSHFRFQSQVGVYERINNYRSGGLLAEQKKKKTMKSKKVLIYVCV